MIWKNANKTDENFFFYFTQARSVLERHLVIADRAFTMADLKAKNETIILPTQRDSLRIRVKEEDKGNLVLAINFIFCDFILRHFRFFTFLSFSFLVYCLQYKTDYFPLFHSFKKKYQIKIKFSPSLPISFSLSMKPMMIIRIYNLVSVNVSCRTKKNFNLFNPHTKYTKTSHYPTHFYPLLFFKNQFY